MAVELVCADGDYVDVAGYATHQDTNAGLHSIRRDIIPAGTQEVDHAVAVNVDRRTGALNGDGESLRSLDCFCSSVN